MVDISSFERVGSSLPTASTIGSTEEFDKYIKEFFEECVYRKPRAELKKRLAAIPQCTN
jgi:hypothetical protein